MGTPLTLSGRRFNATYLFDTHGRDAEAMAQELCVEQTVEFPLDLIDRADILEQVVGRVVSATPVGPKKHEVVISFPMEIVGGELTQLLNVVFGNISLKSGIRLTGLDFPPEMTAAFAGPRFGRTGLRQQLWVPQRPLVASALKPMGLSARDLAQQATELALAGIDIIKDDHGLTDQVFCPYDERVTRCAEAVAEASAKTGHRTLYMPNITAAPQVLRQRAELAREVGAGGVVVAPGIAGFAAMSELAADDGLALPILSHPAWLGSHIGTPTTGLSHGVLFGTLMRLAGADAVIFPCFGGRFSLTHEECRQTGQATAVPLGRMRATFPVPAGGVTVERALDVANFYGNDVILLIAADLHRGPSGLVDTCRSLMDHVAGKPGNA
jgi:ribulose-bisphosphate carboxylase large chain